MKLSNSKAQLLGWVIFVALVNVAVRAWNCTLYLPNGDEPFTLYFSQWSYLGSYDVLLRGNNTPIYEWLLHSVNLVVDMGWEGARILSVLLVALGAVALALAGRIKSNRLALFVGCMFLASPLMLQASHLIRGYALAMALICSLLFLTQLLIYTNASRSGRSQRWALIAWTTCAFLIPHVHFLGWLLLIPPVLILARKGFRRTLLLLGASLLPLILHTLNRFSRTLEEGTVLDAPQGLETLTSAFLQLNGHREMAAFSLLVLGISLISILIKRGRSSSPRLGIVAWIWLIPLIVYLVAALVFPLHAPRYISLFVPYWLFFLAWKIDQMLEAWDARGAVTVVCALCLVSPTRITSPVYASLNGVGKEMERIPSPKTAFVISPLYCDLPFARMLQPTLFNRGREHEKSWASDTLASYKQPLYLEMLEARIQVFDAGNDLEALDAKVLESDTLCLCNCGLWRYPTTNLHSLIQSNYPNRISHFQDDSIEFSCFTKHANDSLPNTEIARENEHGLPSSHTSR